MPLGRVSVNATPVSELPLLGLVIVKLSVVAPPAAIVEGANDIEIDGRELTVKVALAAVPAVSASLAVTVLVVSMCPPTVLLVTESATVQEALAARVFAVTEIVPAVVSRFVDPPEVASVSQVPPLSVISVTPLGTALLNETLCNGILVFGFVTVMVRVELFPDGMVAGANAAAMVGVSAVMVMEFDVPLIDRVVSVTVIVCVPLVWRMTEIAPAVSGPAGGRLAVASVLENVNVSDELEIELLN